MGPVLHYKLMVLRRGPPTFKYMLMILRRGPQYFEIYVDAFKALTG